MRDWPDFSRHQLPPDVQAHIDWLEARVMELEEGLLAEFEPALMVAYGLSPQQARLLGALAMRPFLSRDMAMAVLYAGEPTPPNDKIIDVILCKIRPAIAHEIEIETLWGKGWRLPPDQRHRLLERFSTAPAQERAA